MAILCLLLFLTFCYGLDNGLGLQPQLAWNSWNKFGCNINEDLIHQTADALVSTGLRDAGYLYLNLDDCWEAATRDSNGQLYGDPTAFPSGMKSLGDYIHSQGLRYGIYSSAGYKTCQGRPASLGYETTDANSFASWGVDYLKYDNCNTDGTPPETRYPPMRDALNASGRPIFFSMCEWGVDRPWTWAQPVGNSWRTTGDIKATWESIMSKTTQNEPLWPFAAPGGWNDPDMLEVGNGHLTFEEEKSHFSLWAMMKAPLIIGCDVRSLSNDTKSILLNTEIIAINQDGLGQQGKRIKSYGPTLPTPCLKMDGNGVCVVYEEEKAATLAPGSYEIWGNNMTSSAFAVILFNRDTSEGNITVQWSELGLSAQSYSVRDLWLHQNMGVHAYNYTATVKPHGVVVIKLT